MVDHPKDICPICKGKATPLTKTGDARGFDCKRHGRFRVAESVFAPLDLINAGIDQWEAALAKAKARQPDDAWAPVIRTYDF